MINTKLCSLTASDLPTFYLHQVDEEAARMADFPIRTEADFYTHWHRIMADPLNILRTVLYEGQVAGNVVSFILEGRREVGYWLGREFWGRGIATAALQLFLEEIPDRPLYAFTAHSNPASARVLQKCGFFQIERTAEGLVFRLE